MLTQPPRTIRRRGVMHATRSGHRLGNTANDNHRGWYDKPVSWSQWPLYLATFLMSVAAGAGIMALWTGRLYQGTPRMGGAR